MKIGDYLSSSCIKGDVEAASMEDAIDILVSLQEKAGNISDKEKFKKEVLLREKEGSTALDIGVAIPHAKSGGVSRPALSKIELKSPLDWNGKAVSSVYLLASPDSEGHIEMLSALARGLLEKNGENDGNLSL